MPSPAPLSGPFTGYQLVISKQDVLKIQFWIMQDGNGEAMLPVRRYKTKAPSVGKLRYTVEPVIVRDIPGSALATMATFMTGKMGFKVNVSSESFVTYFMFLTVP